MDNFYEVPVIVELDEESMCVYMKVFANSVNDAKIKAEAIANDEIVISVDQSDIIKI